MDSLKKIEQDILNCQLCEHYNSNGALCISQKETGLKYGYPNCNTEIMIIAESPPAPGKGFFYNTSSKNNRLRKKTFDLINKSNLVTQSLKSLGDFDKAGFYLADAINCRWDKSISKSLSKSVFTNCSKFLIRQINLLKPRAIITFGKKAKKSIEFTDDQKIIYQINLSSTKIINLQFPLGNGRYMNETDDDRIKVMRTLI